MMPRDRTRGSELPSIPDDRPNRHIDFVSSPRSEDVLLGRGFTFSWHEGNARFKKIIDETAPAYFASVSRHDKSRVVQQVFERIKSMGCRFLKQDKKTGLYFSVTEKEAREKISQAIRYKKRGKESSVPRQRTTKTLKLPALPKSQQAHTSQIDFDSLSNNRSLSFDSSSSASSAYTLELFDDASLTSILGQIGEYDWPSNLLNFYDPVDDVSVASMMKELRSIPVGDEGRQTEGPGIGFGIHAFENL